MSISQRIDEIKNQLPIKVELIAVSKTKPESAIMEAYEYGHKHFGENKVQDLVTKYEHLPKDIRWHFIGHLQTNKVKFIAPFIHLIHAVDSEKLLAILDKEAEKNNRIIDCLLQAKVAKEESKFGMTFEEILSLLDLKEKYSHVRIKGLMAMATNTDDEEEIRSEFASVNQFFETIKNEDVTELSLGMSDDWPIAVEEGSTMIRVGSQIFGKRNYL